LSKAVKVKAVSWETLPIQAVLSTGSLSPGGALHRFDFLVSVIEDKT
jgi:hypothetical protein